jgi:hypothetical protein
MDKSIKDIWLGMGYIRIGLGLTIPFCQHPKLYRSDMFYMIGQNVLQTMKKTLYILIL